MTGPKLSHCKGKKVYFCLKTMTSKVLVSLKMFGGRPIECWLPAEYKSNWEDYTGKLGNDAMFWFGATKAPHLDSK